MVKDEYFQRLALSPDGHALREWIAERMAQLAHTNMLGQGVDAHISDWNRGQYAAFNELRELFEVSTQTQETDQ